MPSFLTAILVPLLCTLLLRPLTANERFNSQPSLATVSKVLLLTAHPDDECMFFAPTVLSLVRQRDGNLQQTTELFSLCLSTGNAQGLGETRQIELQRSLQFMGVPEANQKILDHPALPDNMSFFWEPKVIADVLRPYVLEHNIDTILTFDRQGISGHANHISLPYGARSLLTTSVTPLRLFTLVSVPTVSKYMGQLSALLAKFDIYTSRMADVPVFVSGVREWWTAVNAMRKHHSQLVWFRWLYVLCSRYMWVNEWVEVVV